MAWVARRVGKAPSRDDDDEGADGDKAGALGRVGGSIVPPQPVTVDLVHAATLRA